MMDKHNDSQSKYPSLHCFLKYATATSSSINSMLFDTQTDSFKNLVYSLENTLVIEVVILTRKNIMISTIYS